MRRVLRTAMMVLIALAIPLQGLAAATMLSCGPGHHRMMAARLMAEHTPVHDHAAHGHDAAAATALADGAAAPADVAAAAASAADASALDDLNQLSKFKCSACAACTVTTAPPSRTVNFDPLKQSAVFVLAAATSGTSFLTGGLERPPRHLLV